MEKTWWEKSHCERPGGGVGAAVRTRRSRVSPGGGFLYLMVSLWKVNPPGFPSASGTPRVLPSKAERSGFSGVSCFFGKGEDARWSMSIQLLFSAFLKSRSPFSLVK